MGVSDDPTRVALVTGASRGIGKASALALADQGFDVAVTARTVVEGEAADGRPIPGSIETTAEAVRERGRRALAIPMDLLERKSIDAAVDRTLAEWGRIDVLLNNAIYTGEGTMQLFEELTDETLRTIFEANVFAQIHVTGRVLPGMLERGSGVVLTMVSGAGMSDPPAPANKGGWGFAYGASKGAIQRMAGVLAVEYAGRGVRFVNVEPGFVQTEAMFLNDPEGELAKRFQAAPMEVPAAVNAWLATRPEADEHDGQTVFAQKLCLELGLQPDWRS